MMSPQLEDIVRKVRSDERIAPAEALVLWHEAPLWLLGELAARRKERVSGDKVYFNRNFHIEPTNLCVFNCNFCSYRRPKGSPEAWDYSLEEVERIARDHAGQGLTEVHIVGGVHPEHDLYYYVEMIRRVKAILPEATVKAFTAIELSYMIRKAGLTIDEGLRLLRSAGMEAIPGGGAEIFDEELRARICPDKGSTAEWFEVHAAAHRLGIPTNATILYGHIECVEQHRNLDTLINLDVNELGRTDQLIKTMNIVELNQFLEQQQSKGSDSINIIQVEQHARYAYPVGTFILTLIGVSLSSRKVRGGTGLHIGIGIALCFSYILFIRFFEEFAKSGTLPPWIAVWIPNVLYLCIAVYLYRKAPK